MAKLFYNKNFSQGTTLLFAVLTASLLLFVSAALSTIALKESQLSSIGEDSQIAFYAADLGAECALYWDLAQEPSRFDPLGIVNNISCNGSNFNVGGGGYSGNPAKAEYFLDFCAVDPDTAYPGIVKITKFESPIKTMIESSGYNICTTNARRFERQLRADY